MGRSRFPCKRSSLNRKACACYGGIHSWMSDLAATCRITSDETGVIASKSGKSMITTLNTEPQLQLSKCSHQATVSDSAVASG